MMFKNGDIFNDMMKNIRKGNFVIFLLSFMMIVILCSCGNNKYSGDGKINRFIKAYNAVSEYEMTDLSQGYDIHEMFGNSNDCSIKMYNCGENSGGYSFIVTINGGDNEEMDVKMDDVFKSCVHVLDKSITDKQIEEALSDLKKGNIIGDYTLGDDLHIYYHSYKHGVSLSGIADSLIEISMSY